MLITGKHGVIITVLMIVMAILCRFILIDLGDAGRQIDGGVLTNLGFGSALEAGSYYLPNSCPLPGTTQLNLPFVIVGVGAFPL